MRFDRAAACACAVLMVFLPITSGCHLPAFPLVPFLSPPEEAYQLRTIDGIDLDEESTSAPVTLDEVARADSSEILPPGSDSSPIDSKSEELPVPVAERLDLTLADARASALESNLELQVQEVNPAIARQVIWQEKGRFEATFNSTYVRNRIDAPPGFLAGGLPDRTLDRFTNSVSQPLTTGGEIRALHDVTKTDVHGMNDPNAVDTDLGLEFRQPLLRGFGYLVNTADIQIARTQTGIADARSKLTAIRALADVERAYWRLYSARQLHDIALQQLDLANRQTTIVKRLLSAGVVTNVELLVAESGVSVRENAAIQTETNVRLAERELKRIMQRPDAPVDGPTKLVLITDPNPLGLVFDRQQLTAQALDNRMEMLELQLELMSDAIERDVQQNSILPRLDLTAEIDALGLESSYRKSMDVLFENDFGDRLVGIALEVPLSGNVSARARLREVQLRMMQNRIEQKRVSVVITQEVYDAIDRVEQNWERVVATRQAEVSAQRAYEGQLRLQEAGRQTVTDVLVALQSFGDAKAEAVLSVVDYQIAKVDLALAAGAMLGYGQVEWSPCFGPLSPLPAAEDQEAAPAELPPPMPPASLRLPSVMLPIDSNAAETSSPSAPLSFPTE